ncbi:DUF4091 domain-containing protein [Sphingobacterium hungaricum]|nr:DUF4091 domain-containing protein [Sphingobacterium hungaricum]
MNKNKFLLLSLIGLLTVQAHPLFAQKTSETFVEMADPTADTLADWSKVKNGLHVSFASIDKRFAKSFVPEVTNQQTAVVRGWKGETVSAQVLLWTKDEIPNVEVQLSDFVSKNNTIPKSISQASFVRYVMTDEFAEGCGHRKPEDFASSLSPDMLDDLTSYDLEAKKVRPVWLTIQIPRDAPKGEYNTAVLIKSEGKTLRKLTLRLEVLDQILPEPKNWTFHLDQWQHPSAVARTAGVEMWSDAHFEAMKPVMKRLADAGQKVITATLNKDPWNVQTYDPYADMIIWEKKKDGTWTYDYSVFDKWVSFMLDLGITKMLNCYSIIPWNSTVHYKDEATGQFVDVVAKAGTPIFEEIWEPFLTDFVKHLKQKNWLSFTNIAIDERSKEEMDAAFALLKKVSPELGISYADNQKTYKRFPDSEDISIAVGHPYSKEDIADRRARGLNSTYYICCSDEFPNSFTFSDPAESTFLAWYALASGFDGVLHWAYNSWVEKPLQDSRFRTWPAGDTYIVYPGNRSSIRFERMLEGIQDYEKALVLRKKLQETAQTEKLATLNKAIELLDNPTRTATWNANLNKAKELLNSL